MTGNLNDESVIYNGILENIRNHKNTRVIRHLKNLPDEETLWLHSESPSFEAVLQACRGRLKGVLDNLISRVGMPPVDSDALNRGEYTSIMAKLTMASSKYVHAYKEEIDRPVKEWVSETKTELNTHTHSLERIKPDNDNFERLFVPEITTKYHSTIPIPQEVLDAKRAKSSSGTIWEQFVQSRTKSGDVDPLINPYELEIERATDREKVVLKKKLQSLLYEYVPPQEDVQCSEIEAQKRVLLQGSNSSRKYPGPFAEYLAGSAKSNDINLPSDNFTFVDTEVGLDDVMRIVRSSKHPIFTFDVECYQKNYMTCTALIQISTVEQDIIIDPLPFIKVSNYRALEKLNDIFCDPQILKVGHGINNDVEWLQRDCSIYIVNVFDTYVGANVMGLQIRKSLQGLVSHFLKIKMNKGEQMSDWSMRPLTKSQMKYARLDTRLLIYVFHVMKNEMISKHKRENMVQTVMDMTGRVAKHRYNYKGSEFHHLHARLVRTRMHQPDPLHELIISLGFLWRERLAKSLDVAPWMVATDAMIIPIMADDAWKDPASQCYLNIETHLNKHTSRSFMDDDVPSLYAELKPYMNVDIDLTTLYKCVTESQEGKFNPLALLRSVKKNSRIVFPEDSILFKPPPLKIPRRKCTNASMKY